MSLNRKGFTLMELIVGAVIGSVVMTGVLRTVLSTQRNSQSITQRIDVQQSVRSATHFLSTMFRELNADDGDLITLSPNQIRFRGMRWVGILCADPVQVGSDVILPIRQTPFYGVEAPNAVEDSIFIYRDGLTSTRTDDRWVPGGLRSTNTGLCSDGSVASLLRVGINLTEGGADSVVTGVTEGAPIRGFGVAELSTTQDAAGRWWLGRRMANRSGGWTSVEPLIGPITSGGFQLNFFDANDNTTTTPTDVRSIALTVRGESMGRTSGNADGHVRDSMVTRVTLRNNRRF